MKGRTFDLKTAFKQLGIHPTDLAFAKVLVWNPTSRKPAVLALKALSHRKCTRLQPLQPRTVADGSQPLDFASYSVFDDFTSVTIAEDCQSVETSFLLLLKLLGWKGRSDRQQGSDLCRSFHQSGHRLYFASHARWFRQSA